MPRFHRYTQPAWFGAATLTVGAAVAQPSGKDYDFLNVDDDGGGAGALVYDQTTNGPNQYTYFLSLRESGVTPAFNRGLKALADNTDYFDDLLNADKIQLVSTTIAVGSPTSTIAVPADAYLGPAAHVLTADNLQQLFRICDMDFTETVDLTSNTAVVVQACSLGTAPDPFDYAAGTETLTTNVALVVSSYRLLYFRRTSYALSDRELLRQPGMQAHVSMPGPLQVLLQDVRGDGLLWSATPEVSLRTLARRGLAGVYASTNTIPVPDSVIADYYTNYNTANSAGSGAFFTRAGQAVVGISRTDLLTSSPYRDPLGAIWMSYVADYNLGNGTGIRQFVAGSRGFAYVGRRQRVTNAGAADYAPALAAFAAYTEHKDTYGTTADAFTRIDTPLACSIQRVSTHDEINITVGTNYFSKAFSGAFHSALVLGKTLIEVYWANPSDPVTTSGTHRVYRLKEIVSNSKIRVMGQDGSDVNFPASLTGASITRVMTPTVVAPDGYAELQKLKGNAAWTLLENGPLEVFALPPATHAAADDSTGAEGAYFGAARNSSSYKALSWGGYEHRSDQTEPFQYRRRGTLRGDGGISCPIVVADAAAITSLVATTVTNDTLASNHVTTVLLTVSNTAAVGTLLADEATAELLNLQRVRRISTTLDVVGSVAIDLTTELTDGNRARVRFTGSTLITGITIPSVLLGEHSTFSIVFDASNHPGQVNGVGAWPVGFVFENPADALLTCLAGWVDVYTIDQIAAEYLVTVKRYEL